MANLNTISKEILHNIGKPFDVSLDARVKELLKHSRSKILKDRLDRDGVDDTYAQSYKIDIEQVDKADDCKVNANCTIYKSKNPIWIPMYYKTDAPFMLVSSVDGVMIIIHTSLASSKHQRFARFVKKPYMYEIRNKHIYFYNMPHKMRILLKGIFPNTELITDDCDNDACYSDNMEFPVDDGLLIAIKDLVYKELGYSNAVNNEVEEIKVDKHE